MAIPSNHFDMIVEKVLRQFGQQIADIKEISKEVGITEKKHHFVFRYIYDRFNNDIKISRTITVSEIDLDDIFTVEFEEALAAPHFTVSRRCTHHNADDMLHMDHLYRQIYDFLIREIDPKRFPTPANVEHLQELRRWGAGQYAELYFASDEFDDLWKIRLVEPKTNIVMVDHLDVDIPGPMLQKLYHAYQDGFRNGRVDGMNTLVERLAADEADRALQKTFLRPYDVRESIKDFIHTGSLSAIGKLREQ
jgi:hypothetical protein